MINVKVREMVEGEVNVSLPPVPPLSQRGKNKIWQYGRGLYLD